MEEQEVAVLKEDVKLNLELLKEQQKYETQMLNRMYLLAPWYPKANEEELVKLCTDKLWWAKLTDLKRKSRKFIKMMKRIKQ